MFGKRRWEQSPLAVNREVNLLISEKSYEAFDVICTYVLAVYQSSVCTFTSLTVGRPIQEDSSAVTMITRKMMMEATAMKNAFGWLESQD